MDKSNQGYVERNAWLFLIATPLTFALNGLGIVTGLGVLSLIAWVALPILVFCALGGFVARAVTKSEERRQSEEPGKSEYSGPPTVAERNAMMDRIINRRP